MILRDDRPQALLGGPAGAPRQALGFDHAETAEERRAKGRHRKAGKGFSTGSDNHAPVKRRVAPASHGRKGCLAGVLFFLSSLLPCPGAFERSRKEEVDCASGLLGPAQEQTHELCPIMLGSLQKAELTGERVAILTDSGASVHACPPWHATHVPLEEKSSVTARGASGAELVNYGR